MSDPLVRLLVQLGLLLITALVLGQIVQRFGMPAIVGELAAGIVLGPGLLGTIAPTVFQTVFPPGDPVKPARDYIVRIGLLIFLFLVGQEVDFGGIGKQLSKIIWPGLLGVALPFILVFTALWLFPGFWGQPQGSDPLATPLALSIAISYASLPFLGRTLTDLGLVRSQMGTLVLAVALIDDTLGSLGFAALAGLSASSQGGGQSTPLWQLLLMVLLIFALTATLGRQLGQRIGVWLERHRNWSDNAIGWTAVAILLTSALMQVLGVGDIFGALMVGLALSSVPERVFTALRQVARYFFSPLVFATLGIGANFLTSFDVGLVVAVLLIASVGKIGGVFLGGRIGGIPTRDSLAVATGMNARGPVDIVAASIALQANLIDERLFVACVFMVLVTALTAGALMQRILHVAPPAKLVKAIVPILQRLDPFGRPVEEIEIGPRLTIGRDPSNRLALPTDELVSRQHAIIRDVNGQFRIEDLTSTNGTLIWRDTHWAEVTLDELRDGDIIVIGANVFRFSQGQGAGARAQPQEV